MSERDFALSIREGRLDDILDTDTTAVPAAGAVPATITVPGGEVWLIKTMYAQLTTSATVATRIVGWTVDDGTNTLFKFVSTTGQLASQANVGYTGTLVSAQMGTTSSNTGIIAPSAPFPLLPGWRIALATTAIQATDQWTALRVVHETLDLGRLTRPLGPEADDVYADMMFDAIQLGGGVPQL